MSDAIAVDLAAHLRIVSRGFNRVIRNVVWALRHAPITDDERYTLRLARRHIREGRTDLAAEDFAWLGRRYANGGDVR